jgi:ROK family
MPELAGAIRHRERITARSPRLSGRYARADGARCRCGNRGCLETIVSTSAFARPDERPGSDAGRRRESRRHRGARPSSAWSCIRILTSTLRDPTQRANSGASAPLRTRARRAADALVRWTRGSSSCTLRRRTRRPRHRSGSRARHTPSGWRSLRVIAATSSSWPQQA